tara:strand:+ start:1982 stop:2242 length:261 start_codon:yes stop_codon:yes gene_type:complete
MSKQGPEGSIGSSFSFINIHSLGGKITPLNSNGAKLLSIIKKFGSDVGPCVLIFGLSVVHDVANARIVVKDILKSLIEFIYLVYAT